MWPFDFISAGYDKEHPLPNIVFIMADDMGYGDVHYNGGPAHTPNLDAMADRPNSIQFNRHYSGGPTCSPTRGTVLTGRNHNRYCIWDVNVGWKCDDFTNPVKMPLPPSEITVAEILKEHGYHTAAFGKWHIGDVSPCPLPHSHELWPISHPGVHGFDTWWMTDRIVPTVFPNCACFEECSSREDLPQRVTSEHCHNYHTIENKTGFLKSWPEVIEGDDSLFIYERFAEFLQDVVFSEQPFFAYVAFHAVHIPYFATEYHYNHYISQGYNSDQANYYGVITAMDEAIGKIKSLLKRYGVSDNTLLWFTSDNGPPTNVHPASTAGLSGFKGMLYEGGIRVPGIIEWPAVIKENQKTEFPVVTSDLLPTVCDILGVDPPSDRPIDGISILPLLRGEISTRDKPIGWMFDVENIYQGYGDFKTAALVNNQYKLFAKYKSGYMMKAMLYDLVEDPFEFNDVKDEHPKLFESMKRKLSEWRRSVIQSANDEVKCVGYSVYDAEPRCYSKKVNPLQCFMSTNH